MALMTMQCPSSSIFVSFQSVQLATWQHDGPLIDWFKALAEQNLWTGATFVPTLCENPLQPTKALGDIVASRLGTVCVCVYLICSLIAALVVTATVQTGSLHLFLVVLSPLFLQCVVAVSLPFIPSLPLVLQPTPK